MQGPGLLVVTSAAAEGAGRIRGRMPGVVHPGLTTIELGHWGEGKA